YAGMVAVTCIASACALRSTPIRLAVVAVSIYALLLVSSRTALVAAFTMLLVYAAIRIIEIGRDRPGSSIWLLTLSAIGATAALLMATLLFGSAFQGRLGLVLNEIFLLSDPYRGITSGASGRSQLWAAALDIW